MSWQIELKSMAARVNTRLAELLPSLEEKPIELVDAMRYSCLAPGKRLRPILVLSAAEAVGGGTDHSLDAACAVEILHCFSLIHDDLPAIDNDDLRRGVPTCHVKFGEAVAIMAGDALFALVFEILASLDAPAEQRVRAVQLISRTSGVRGLVSGETIDILSEGKEIDAETLELIHRRKTGALIEASCELGALLGGGDSSQIARLKRFGEDIGLAFQIADDVLNEVGDAALTGKSVGSDEARGKATYVKFFGVEASRARALALAEDAKKQIQGFPNEEFLASIASYSVERLS